MESIGNRWIKMKELTAQDEKDIRTLANIHLGKKIATGFNREGYLCLWEE
jgi:hypothetical protein